MKRIVIVRAEKIVINCLVAALTDAQMVTLALIVKENAIAGMELVTKLMEPVSVIKVFQGNGVE